MKGLTRKYVPLSLKLFLSYLCLVLIPVIVIGSYSYYSSVQSIRERTESNLQVAMEQMDTNIDYRLADILRVSDQIFNDQVLSRYFSNSYPDWDKYLFTTQYVIPKVESAIHLSLIPVSLSLYLDHPAISEAYYKISGDPLETGRNYSIFHTDRLKHAAWYSQLNFDFNSKAWMQIESDEQYQNISFVRPIIDYDSLKSQGFMKITVKLSDIFGSVDYNKLGQGTHLFVLNDRQNLLYASSSDATSSTVLLAQDKTPYLTKTKTITNFPAQLVAFIPTSTLRESSLKVRTVTIIVCLLSLAVLSAISFYISQRFSRRINKLVQSLQSFQEGEFHKRITYSGNDEFVGIAKAFNDMAATMEQLIDEVYVSNLQKKEAELQVLHSQINPHFLYNTFSSISRMAKLGEIDKMHEMIRSLAKFYRLTLNKGELMIKIDKEIQQIRAYIEIQRIKYAERILVNYEIDPVIMDYATVKFILQPFVENVLEHAWYDDLISIWIRAYGDKETIIFEIQDNGLGISEETLDQIFNVNGTSMGYGIGNVNERIKLHFGKWYGVTMQSSVGSGTTVRITLPKHQLDAPRYLVSKKEEDMQ
ncbi:sensor histidine kinase [Paenibacillus sp. SI8]|uniref:sensor histidine kinase n=1 Tax=unclassified Paenibacillus TaxID=185978 RepID=UPI0034657F42